MKDTLPRASRILPDHSPCARSRLSLFTFPISQPIVLRKRESGSHRCFVSFHTSNKTLESANLAGSYPFEPVVELFPCARAHHLGEVLNQLVGQLRLRVQRREHVQDGCRDCRSTMMVPNVRPRRNEKSSMPICVTCPTGSVGRAMMRRRMVWREVCISRRSVTRTPSLPPGALPMICMI